MLTQNEDRDSKGRFVKGYSPSRFSFQKGHIPWNNGKKEVYSEQTLSKMSEAKKGKYSGKSNPFYGKHHTKEALKQISNARKNREFSEEQRRKMSASLKKAWEAGKFKDRSHDSKKHSETLKTKYAKGEIVIWSKGKSKETDERIRRKAKKHSETMKRYYRLYPERHPNRIMAKKDVVGYISIPQRALYKILKEIYLDAELEYPIRTKNSVKYADIGIPSLRLDFEYDGSHFHNDKVDFIRDEELLEVGWVTIRINKEGFNVS